MAELPLNFEARGILYLPGKNSNDHNADFYSLIGTVLSITMTIALLILLFMLVTGAIQWMTSGGEGAKLTEARERITNAIIGIIILSGSLAIFLFIQWILGIQILTFN